MNILVTICARGGSKGIPGKNVKVINGMPLIAYSINCAKKFKELMRGRALVDIELSTDSEHIKEVASFYGLESDYVRPDFLANDTAGKVDAIADVYRYASRRRNRVYDYVLDLDCTSPLRTQNDLLEALNMIESDTQALVIYSVSEAARNPYFNQVEKKENGYYDVVKKVDSLFMSRQVAPIVYDMNASFYFYTKKFFDEGFRSTETERTLVYLMHHICFDLDNPIDFEFMSFLLENNKLDFKL